MKVLVIVSLIEVDRQPSTGKVTTTSLYVVQRYQLTCSSCGTWPRYPELGMVAATSQLAKYSANQSM